MDNLTEAMRSLSINNRPSNARLNMVNSSTRLAIRRSYSNALKLASDFKKATGQVIKYPIKFKRQATIVYHLIVVLITIATIYKFYHNQTDLYIYSDESHVRIILAMVKLVVNFNNIAAKVAGYFPAVYSIVYTSIAATAKKAGPKLWKDPSMITRPLNVLNSSNFANIQQKVWAAVILNVGRSIVPGSTVLIPNAVMGASHMLKNFANKLNTKTTPGERVRLYRQLYRQYPGVMYPFRREFDNFIDRSMLAWTTTITTLATLSTMELAKTSLRRRPAMINAR